MIGESWLVSENWQVTIFLKKKWGTKLFIIFSESFNVCLHNQVFKQHTRLLSILANLLLQQDGMFLFQNLLMFYKWHKSIVVMKNCKL